MCTGKSVMRFLVSMICACAGTLQLGAATLSRLSLDEMINLSTSIIHVRIQSSQTSLRGSTIYTNYQFQTLDTWKGRAPSGFAVPGGIAGGLQQTFDGAPQLTEGKEYVLFLWTSPSGMTQIIGLTQGLFTVSTAGDGTVTALRDISGNTILDPATGRSVKDQPLRIQMGDLTAHIAATLAQGK